MGSINVSSKSKFVLTAEALNEALPKMHMTTKAIHADAFASPHCAIAPGMHTAVNFRYARDPDDLLPEENKVPNAPPDSHVYSRYTASNSNRLEVLLQTGPGGIIHVETPLNPTGEARNLAYFRAKADEKGAYLTVDATFAPPPLQDPLDSGADTVMHSGTEYIGGHSDMLCGLLVLRSDRVEQGWLKRLHKDRQYIGSVMGSFEGWLGIRSARTMQLWVMKQAETAQKLARWLYTQVEDQKSSVGEVLSRVQHASIQRDVMADGWLQKQMPGGFGPVFSVWARDPDHARRLPSRVFVFQHATSLGGWRA
ncbi:hypothetical protein N7512_007876 [Penicillium capsulatum]|nr:hypothetical protein N7512_007876 [Penicillium capsulatum]